MALANYGARAIMISLILKSAESCHLRNGLAFNIARQAEDEMDTGREPALSDDDTLTLDDTTAQEANQAADYARQQLEALNQGLRKLHQNLIKLNKLPTDTTTTTIHS